MCFFPQRQKKDDAVQAQQEERPQTIDTYDNPEQAMAMAETALLTFSKKLNKGLRPLEKDKASSNSLNTVH